MGKTGLRHTLTFRACDLVKEQGVEVEIGAYHVTQWKLLQKFGGRDQKEYSACL